MTGLPSLPLIFLTYGASEQRTEYARRTLVSAMTYLRYSGELLWMVADDGSDNDHWNLVTSLADPLAHLSFRSDRAGYGANANRAWANASSISPVSLWLEDDWELSEPIDLTEYVEILMYYYSVGMIRLGNLPTGLSMKSVGYSSKVCLEIDRGSQYAFSGNPHLKHIRFREAYGDYPEGLSPGDTEVAYDHQIRNLSGPTIIRPAELGQWGPWGHIGAVKSYAS